MSKKEDATPKWKLEEKTKPERSTIDEPMEFDISMKEIPVRVGSENYTIREATGEVATKYRNAVVACMRNLRNGSPTLYLNVADVEPLLVSMCLFDSEGNNVQESTIRSWPSRVQKGIYRRIKDISDLGEEEETLESLQKKIKKLKDEEARAKNS